MVTVTTRLSRTMPKDTYLQIRIRESLKDDLKLVSEARGLSVSALVHSLIVKAIREERKDAPEVFTEHQTAPKGIPSAEISFTHKGGKHRKAG